MPPLRDLEKLDPAGGSLSIYNRYAHITLVPHAGPDITFETSAPGSVYSIHVDPAHDVWRRLGVRYVVLQGTPPSATLLEQATLVATLAGRDLAVYRYRDRSRRPPEPAREKDAPPR